MDKFIRDKAEMGIEADMEEFIDAYGITSLFDVIADIANGKADHLRENWQDEFNARDWDKVAKAIGACSRSTLVAAIDYTK